MTTSSVHRLWMTVVATVTAGIMGACVNTRSSEWGDALVLAWRHDAAVHQYKKPTPPIAPSELVMQLRRASASQLGEALACVEEGTAPWCASLSPEDRKAFIDRLTIAIGVVIMEGSHEDMLTRWLMVSDMTMLEGSPLEVWLADVWKHGVRFEGLDMLFIAYDGKSTPAARRAMEEVVYRAFYRDVQCNMPGYECMKLARAWLTANRSSLHVRREYESDFDRWGAVGDPPGHLLIVGTKK